jgi:hypothetical protein
LAGEPVYVAQTVKTKMPVILFMDDWHFIM